MEKKTSLKRALGLPLLTFYGLGTIVGAGIYVLVGKIAGEAGIYTPFAFLLSGVIAGFTAFSYAELSSRFPLCGGEAEYIYRSLGYRRLSVAAGWLVVFTGVVSSATMARGVVGYAQVFMDVPGWAVSTMVVAVLGGLAIWGIRESAIAAAAITLVEVGGLFYVIFVSSDGYLDLPRRAAELIPPADPGVWYGIVTGAFLAFYAFIGFEDMVNVAEEVEAPEKNLPTGIIISLAVVSVLYMLIALAAVLNLPVEKLAASDAPLADVVSRAGRSPLFISGVSLFAILNGGLIQIIMASRIIYGLSRRGDGPPYLAKVNPSTRTPLRSTALVALVVWLLALFFPVVSLARASSFIILIVFVAVNFSLLAEKRKNPAPEGVRAFPAFVPAAGMALCLFLLLFQAVSLF